MEIKVLSWNCNGKLKQSIEFLQKYLHFHIIHISETKHNSFTEFKVPKKFTPLSRPGIRLGDRDRGGNIVFIRTVLYKRIRKTRYFEWGIVLYFNESVLVFVYFVPSDSRYYKDESFTELFTFLCGVITNGKPVFITGYHNSRFGNLMFTNKSYDENVDTEKNSQGTLLANIYNECGFYPLNHLRDNGQVFHGDFTFFRDTRKSQVDFLFTNNHVDISYFHLDNKGLELSDHKMILFTLNSKLDLPSNALRKWAKDSNKISFSFTDNLFRMKFEVDSTKLRQTLVNSLIVFENRLANTNYDVRSIMKDFNELLQKSFLECKIAKCRKRNSNIDWKYLEGKKLWEKIDWSGKLTSTKDMNVPDNDDLLTYFKNLYAPADELPVELPDIETDLYIPVTDDPINENEILEAFNDQRKGYNFTNAILRPFKNELLPYVLTIMNIVFFASSTIINAPSLLFAIPKKGNLKLAKNWRGIQLGEYINSWYDRILSNRIKLWMNIDEFQTAYQSGKGCNTQIFTFRTISELAKKNKKALFISYVDLEKAFDKVKRSTMLRVLSDLGIGTTMLKALHNLYSFTRVHLKGVSTFVSTSGIRQGASSSVYIFIIFINGLFKYLRSKFYDSVLYGPIHCLIHADDTLVLAEKYETLKQKVISTYEYFGSIDQNVNIGKSKYMCLDTCCNVYRDDMIINGQLVKYTNKEKYLGHYITDDNSLYRSIVYDLEERKSNVMIKFRNFINNNRNVTIDIRLKVFQACFCSTILSNCEIWGQYFPKKVLSLYNSGLKLAIEVRSSTPTALIFLETKQPSVLAMVRKRQLKFWLSLKKEVGSEMYNLVKRAEKTNYIKHYRNLETLYGTPHNAYETINREFYNEQISIVENCRDEQSKLKTYKTIYDIRNTTITVTLNNKDEELRQILTRYVVSSHNLASELGKWSEHDKNCKKCSLEVPETLCHFLIECDAYENIRSIFDYFPSDLRGFFEWEHCGQAITLLHQKREK